MNREIKFRAWLDHAEEMITDFAFFINNGRFIGDNGKNLTEIMDVTDRDIVIMQYTGLKDKNGKEIYEGDIVEAWSEGSKGTFQIKWRQEGSPSWILFPAWQNGKIWHISTTEYTIGKKFIRLDGSIETSQKVGFYDDGLTVIGNIYEHPNLLQL